LVKVASEKLPKSLISGRHGTGNPVRIKKPPEPLLLRTMLADVADAS
jgi:hypothetical protein